MDKNYEVRLLRKISYYCDRWWGGELTSLYWMEYYHAKRGII